MKTILVPIDYSETAHNALQYAIGLAKFNKAKIVLLHAYQVPIPTTEMPVVLALPDDLEKENIARIKTLEKEISKQLNDEVKVEHLVRMGFAVDEIMTAAKEKKADLIVMGVTGQGKLGETLIGSNATWLIQKTHTPVLVVPQGAKFKKPEKIVWAYDYRGEVPENQSKKVKEYTKLFNANLFVLDIVKTSQVPTYENAVAGVTIEAALNGVKHSTYFPEGEDIESEINTFVDTYKADWLMMIPHKHTLFERLFHKSNTKRMAFHTHVPLLIIH